MPLYNTGFDIDIYFLQIQTYRLKLIILQIQYCMKVIISFIYI